MASKDYYNKDKDSVDFREIRNVEGKLIKAGRCKEGLEECICSDIFVKPNGDVRACGCVDSLSFGNINGKWKVPDDWEWSECYKNQKEVEKEIV